MNQRLALSVLCLAANAPFVAADESVHPELGILDRAGRGEHHASFLVLDAMNGLAVDADGAIGDRSTRGVTTLDVGGQRDRATIRLFPRDPSTDTLEDQPRRGDRPSRTPARW